jgi:hypothetical protein
MKGYGTHMVNGVTLPVIAGLAAGIILVMIFPIFGSESLASIGRVTISLSPSDGGVRPEYNLRVNHIDRDMLTDNDAGMLSHLIENTPANPFYDLPYEDKITKQHAKQLMKILQFSNITSYSTAKSHSPESGIYIALIRLDGSGESQYYRIMMFLSNLPDKELASFNIVQASPPR